MVDRRPLSDFALHPNEAELVVVAAVVAAVPEILLAVVVVVALVPVATCASAHFEWHWTLARRATFATG